jgi:hypothetical protein
VQYEKVNNSGKHWMIFSQSHRPDFTGKSLKDLSLPEKGLLEPFIGEAGGSGLVSAITAAILAIGILFGTYVGNSLAKFQPSQGLIAFSRRAS